MSLQHHTSERADRIELDIESLNLDAVSEKYQKYLAELRAWFTADDNDGQKRFHADQSNGRTIG